MRKVRREIVKTINDYRSRFQRPQIYLDANTNAAAYEYAKYLLKERAWDNPDEGVLEELCQAFKLIPKQKAIVGFSHLDDDAASGDPTKMAEFMDAHGLLLEMQSVRTRVHYDDRRHLTAILEDSSVVHQVVDDPGVR